MSSSHLVKLAALAVIVALCATFAAGVPQLFRQEEPVSDQQYLADDEPLTRYRRDNIAAGADHHQKGWGWEKPKGWGWEKPKGWGWEKPKHHGWEKPKHHAVGPVFTYVRTDGWSNFQWGVRHKVGGDKGWGKGDDYGHGGGGGGGGGGHGHGYGYLGPVYTYAKTDYHANFKWGVRHHVGGHHHG